ALIGGVISFVVGIIFIVIWFGYFVKALQAGLPALFIFGGALAIYLGIEEWKDKRSAESFDEESNTDKLKDEVESIKKEVKDLKKEEKGKKGK
ncbi:unnamed protein product, partial [marine sediment metagenome]